jgi:uncharacterized repeat protein (TIGR03803 family)
MKLSPLSCLIAWFLFLNFTASPLVAAAGQSIHGQVPPREARSKPVSRLEAAKHLNLAIGLPLRNREALTNLLRDLYDPASPRFHQYLTADQFAEQFGPTREDYQALKQFAQAHGLTVTGTHPNRSLLDVSGAAADIERAFHFHFHLYQHPTENRLFFAPDADPSLDLSVPVLGISGLDNFVLPHPMNLKTAAFQAGAKANAADFVTGSGPGGYFIGNDFRAAYAPGVALNGAGQSVGLFELDGYYPNDIAEYESLAKLPNVALTNILLNGFNGAPGEENIEVALDIDMAICMAPGLLQVMVYEGFIPNDVLNKMATDNQAKQLSSSWGFGSSIDPVRDQIYQQYAAQGQSMFQASGDSGAYGSYQTNSNPLYAPSDDPYITIVGGTSMTTTGPGGAWVSETTWSGSGGGVSSTFSIPIWQQGVSMSANHGSTTMRNIPDVSCQADISIWLVAENGRQGPIGGSSASTPLWAGFAALANQQAAANGQTTIGFINPALYAVGQSSGYTLAYHDITTGNNTNAASPTNYFAVPGFDLCTGWGSPAGSNLINALTPEPLQITPATTLVFSGPAGGPFSPASQTIVLTNVSLGSASWALGHSSSWLTASPASGALASGGPAATVTLSLTPSALTLPIGNDPASLWFTNLNDRSVQTRSVILDVVVAPGITQQPASQNVPLGGTAVFAVGTASNALQFFQWQDNGTNLSDGGNIFGSAASALTISNVNAADIGTYRVVISNAAGIALSQGASLAIISSPPVIITQPASQTAPQGASAVFTVAAAGNSPLSYQWQRDTASLTDGGNVSGSSSSALTLMNLCPSNAGTYSVTVSNVLGQTPSAGAVLTINSFTAAGVSISTLYSFTGGTDGAFPNGLMQETNGDFYGTTQNGGATNSGGTIFQMSPAGALTTLSLFSNTSGGLNPTAALVQAPDGNLYGTTEHGNSTGGGDLFKITTNGVRTRLVVFTGANGSAPYRSLVVGPDGGIYGTTLGGGANKEGAIFRITTNAAFTLLASFNGLNGYNPNELVSGADGNLYGTTLDGGTYDDGTVYQVTTNGTLTSLASFGYASGGYLPYAGLVLMPNGNFLGTTYEGGAYGFGTVFQITPDGAVTVVYSFTGGGDGGHPSAALIGGTDGNFYGTTSRGGACQDGTVFRMSPNGALFSLVQFDGYDGANPLAALVQGSDGNLYGTTQNGGVAGAGVIFRVNINSPGLQISAQPIAQDAYLGANVFFSVAVIGNAPFAYQWKENGTNLTDGGNISGSATRVLTILNVGLANSGLYSVLVTNTGNSVLSDGAALGVIESPPQITMQPASQDLLVGESALFTVTVVGDLPLSYQWQENGTNLTDGGQVSGSASSALTINNLVETNNGIYSVIISNAIASATSEGAVLTVFALSSTGTTVAALHSFTGGDDGGVPNGLVLGANGLLYGTTQNGGAYGDGTVFSLSINGTFTTLASFDGTNGAMPVASLIQGANGLFYGTTQLGGSNSSGTVFSINTNGNINSLYSFAASNGSVGPFTSLVRDAAGNFYGASSNNAVPDGGDIFKMTPGGQLATLYSFPGTTNGTLPSGALALGTDGNFYGMTTNGGAYGYGSVFKMTAAGMVTNIYSFTGLEDGFSPAGQLALGTDGNFYGVTAFNNIVYQGTKNLFYGTVFKITPGGVLTTLYMLDGAVNFTDGVNPDAGLVQASDGNFYGTTYKGYYINYNGSIYDSSHGTVFRVTPAGAFNTMTAFNDFDDGAFPASVLVEGADGSLYGTTTTGGPGGQGTIYRISFTSAPQILTEPVNQTNVEGSTVSFSVTVFGAPPLTCQWQENGNNLTDAANISGSATRALTLNNISPAEAGSYSVLVSNAFGSVFSSVATLTVEVPPVFLSASQTGGILTFTWSATPGQSYQAQYSTNLNAGNWTNLTIPIIAANSVMTASDAIGSGGQKFYRVLLLP